MIVEDTKMGEAEFDCGDEGIKSMAVFCATLVREGIRFNVVDKGTRFLVKMTGY